MSALSRYPISSKSRKNESGSQQYKCKPCQRHHTHEPNQMYGDEMHQQAIKFYEDEIKSRQIGRQLGVDHVMVMTWVKAHMDQLPDAPQPNV